MTTGDYNTHCYGGYICSVSRDIVTPALVVIDNNYQQRQLSIIMLSVSLLILILLMTAFLFCR
jgi:hypothetical protein